jgi:hypothetical protein
VFDSEGSLGYCIVFSAMMMMVLALNPVCDRQ